MAPDPTLRAVLRNYRWHLAATWLIGATTAAAITHMRTRHAHQ